MSEEWALTGLSRRFWGAVGGRIMASGALDEVLARPGLPRKSAERLREYELRWLYYENHNLYRKLCDEGLCSTAVPTEWNPVPAVVAFYVANVLTGDLSISPVNDAADGGRLAAAVEQVWEWSNFQAMRGKLVETAAVMGDAFIKVATKRRGDEPARAVYMQEIAPPLVTWWEADERDFLTAIRIDVPRTTSVYSGEERRHTLVEVWRKDWGDGVGGVAFYETPAGRQVEDERLGEAVEFQSFDDLGHDFIPIVWARVDSHWRRQADGIDLYNQRAWNAWRLNRPLWMVRSNTVGPDNRPLPAPKIDKADLAAEYKEAGDGAVALLYLPGLSKLEAAPPPSDLRALHDQLAILKKGIVDSLPEYRVATLEASTQLATETLQLLLGQAGQRVLDMRAELERALARAQMMALSIARLIEVVPAVFAREQIGDYESGLTNHVFNTRGVFEKTAAAKAQEFATLAPYSTAEGAATVAGYTPREVDALVNLSIAAFPEEARDATTEARRGTTEARRVER